MTTSGEDKEYGLLQIISRHMGFG